MDNKELLEKAKQAKSAEELIVLAKENGIALSDDEAKAYFGELNKSGELSDDELNGVAGGGCHKGGRLVVTKFYSCRKWICKRCGGNYEKGLHKDLTDRHFCMVNYSEKSINCLDCRHCSYEKGLWLCNLPDNMK